MYEYVLLIWLPGQQGRCGGPSQGTRDKHVLCQQSPGSPHGRSGEEEQRLSALLPQAGSWEQGNLSTRVGLPCTHISLLVREMLSSEFPLKGVLLCRPVKVFTVSVSIVVFTARLVNKFLHFPP